MFQKVLQIFLLSVMFVFLATTVFFGMQWFANSLIRISVGVLSVDTVFPASLAEPITSVNAAADAGDSAALQTLPSAKVDTNNHAPAPKPDTTIYAQAAMSVQINSADGSDTAPKILFQRNPQEKLPIASLTKLMTTIVVFRNYNLSERVTIGAQAMAQKGEQGDLKLGQVLTVENLLHVMLMESSNRAAYALAQVMGVDNFVVAMNVQAQSMGLVNTHFADVAGLDSGSYSTVTDLVALTQYIFKYYALFGKIVGLKYYDLYLPDGTFHHKLTNTNELLGQDNIIGGKTGFTNDAKGCFMAIQKISNSADYIISIVLGSSDRFGDMLKIINTRI